MQTAPVYLNEASFLLLEETGPHEFRRVGFCRAAHSYHDNERGWYFGVDHGFQGLESYEEMSPEELEARVKWKREELRII
jgi:hypothetical protein